MNEIQYIEPLQEKMLFSDVCQIIDGARGRIATYVNTEACLTNWNVGKRIKDELSPRCGDFFRGRYSLRNAETIDMDPSEKPDVYQRPTRTPVLCSDVQFGTLGHAFSEKDLENAILSQVEEFLSELGSDFTFVKRQKRKGDMSLYKEYQQNEGFKVNFRDLIIRMVSDSTGAYDIQLHKITIDYKQSIRR